MRPLLFDVDASARPARMTVCFPGRPNKFIVVRIRRDVDTLEEASAAAIAELDAWTPEQRTLLEESAQAAPVATDPPLVAVMIERVEHEERYAGFVYCPVCRRVLGRGDNPAIGYVEACPGCKRRLVIRFTSGAVTIIVSTE